MHSSIDKSSGALFIHSNTDRARLFGSLVGWAGAPALPDREIHPTHAAAGRHPMPATHVSCAPVREDQPPLLTVGAARFAHAPAPAAKAQALHRPPGALFRWSTRAGPRKRVAQGRGPPETSWRTRPGWVRLPLLRRRACCQITLQEQPGAEVRHPARILALGLGCAGLQVQVQARGSCFPEPCCAGASFPACPAVWILGPFWERGRVIQFLRLEETGAPGSGPARPGGSRERVASRQRAWSAPGRVRQGGAGWTGASRRAHERAGARVRSESVHVRKPALALPTTPVHPPSGRKGLSEAERAAVLAPRIAFRAAKPLAPPRALPDSNREAASWRLR